LSIDKSFPQKRWISLWITGETNCFQGVLKTAANLTTIPVCWLNLHP